MITTSVVGNLFLDGDDVEVAVTHDAKSAPTITLSGRGASSVVEKKLTRRKKQRVGFGRLPVDFYVAALSVNGQEIARMDLGVVPRRKFAGDPEAHSLGIWAKCGLKYHRVDCCADQVLIGAPGETRWDDNSKFADGRGGWACGGEINNYPDLFRTIRSVGLEPLPIVETKSGNWEIGRAGTMRLCPIHEHLDEYGKFVYEAVKIADLSVVECWNEPEFYWNLGEAVPGMHGRFREYMSLEDYVRTLRVCCESAKEANPQCKVVLGASLLQGQFSENVYRFGGAPWFDILGVHYLAGNSPYNFGYQVGYLNDIMTRHGESKPIWDTEWGCGGAQPWDALVGGENFRAAYAAKYISLAAMHGIVPAGHFDRISGEHGPLPRAVSLAVITHLLEGARFIGNLDLGRDNAGLLFKRRSGATCGIFWAHRKLRVTLKTTASSVALTGIFGNSERLRISNGLLKLEMNEMPIIVSGLGDIEIADGPYDHEDYREITDYTKHTASRATTDAPRPFPRAQPGEIIVDGDLADWSAIPALCRPHKKQLTVHAPERYKFATYKTLKGEAKVAYDDEHFYIACKVRKDRKAQVDPNVANVLLSMRGFDLGVQWSHFCKGQSLIALMSRPGGPNVIQLGGYDMSIAERELTEAKIATRIEPREIIFEAAIPWDAFRPIKPVPGKFAELLLVFGGDDGNDYYWWYRLLGAHWFSLPPAEQVELKF